MALIRGENVMIYAFIGGFWRPFVCGRSCSITTNQEKLETSGKGNGVSRTYLGVAITWSATFEGLVYLQKPNTVALPDLRLLQMTLTPILFRYQRIDEGGNTYLDEGTAIIISVQDDGAQDSAAGFNCTLEGTGALTQIFTPTVINPPGRMNRYPDIDDTLITVDGQLSFTSPLLIGKQFISVVKDGIGNAILITSGTPVGKEAKVDATTGTVTFGVPFVTGEQAYVLYQDI